MIHAARGNEADTVLLSKCPGCFTWWKCNAKTRVCLECDRCEHRTCLCNANLLDPEFVVLDDDAFDAFVKEALGGQPTSLPTWMQRLGYRTNGWTQGPHAAYPNGRVLVRKGMERNQRLLIHEYGHVLGHYHPGDLCPARPLRSFFDIMGYGLRIYDPHNIRAQSRAWRRKLKEGA